MEGQGEGGGRLRLSRRCCENLGYYGQGNVMIPKFVSNRRGNLLSQILRMGEGAGGK